MDSRRFPRGYHGISIGYFVPHGNHGISWGLHVVVYPSHADVVHWKPYRAFSLPWVTNLPYHTMGFPLGGKTGRSFCTGRCFTEYQNKVQK